MTTSFVDQNLEYLTDQSLPPDAVLAAAGMSQLQAYTDLPGWRQWGAGNLPLLLEAEAGLIRLDLQIQSADDITLKIDRRSLSYVVLRCTVHKLTSWHKRLKNDRLLIGPIRHVWLRPRASCCSASCLSVPVAIILATIGS